MQQFIKCVLERDRDGRGDSCVPALNQLGVPGQAPLLPLPGFFLGIAEGFQKNQLQRARPAPAVSDLWKNREN